MAKYLEWKCVDGSYVYQFKKGGIFSSDHAGIYKVIELSYENRYLQMTLRHSSQT